MNCSTHFLFLFFFSFFLCKPLKLGLCLANAVFRCWWEVKSLRLLPVQERERNFHALYFHGEVLCALAAIWTFFKGTPSTSYGGHYFSLYWILGSVHLKQEGIADREEVG